MRYLSILIGCFFISLKISAQQAETQAEPVFSVEQTTHDFGLINETDGEAIHIFKVKNIGEAPLLISHVQSSCGCAEPEWTREPIQPGQYGDVVIIYNPTNRPGPFKKNITVYTNEKKRRQRLMIQGDVIPKPRRLNAAFHDTIGTVQMETRSFLYYTVRPKEISVKEIWIQNFSDQDVSLAIDNLPSYIKVDLPDKLEPQKPQRLKVTLDGTAIDAKGRTIANLNFVTKTASGKANTGTITVTANFIDNFGNLTPDQRKNGPVLKLPATLVDFGKVKKSGFLGIGGKPTSRQLAITNDGKTPLQLHSVSVDDPVVEVTGLQNKIIQPGETVNIELLINPKKLKQSLETELHIVCNDARGPVRQVKITAEK